MYFVRPAVSYPSQPSTCSTAYPLKGAFILDHFSGPFATLADVEGERALGRYSPGRDNQRRGFTGKILTTGLCAHAEDLRASPRR